MIQVTDMMVANAANLIITVKPASQKNNIQKNYKADPKYPVNYSRLFLFFVKIIFRNMWKEAIVNLMRTKFKRFQLRKNQKGRKNHHRIRIRININQA